MNTTLDQRLGGAEGIAATIDDFVAALQARGIGLTEVNEVVAVLYSLKGEVLRL